MDERRAGGERCQHVGDRGQFVVFQRDRARDVLGFGAGRRDAHRDRLADIAKLVRRQDGLAGALEAAKRGCCDNRLDSVEVARGEHHAAEFVGHMHLSQSRVRNGTAHESDVAHARQPEVGDVLTSSAQEPVVLLARDRSTDSVTGYRVLHEAAGVR